MVMRQLKHGDAFVVFDEATQTANIVPKKQVKELRDEAVQ